jgi:hypothetical protein
MEERLGRRTAPTLLSLLLMQVVPWSVDVALFKLAVPSMHCHAHFGDPIPLLGAPHHF